MCHIKFKHVINTILDDTNDSNQSCTSTPIIIFIIIYIILLFDYFNYVKSRPRLYTTTFFVFSYALYLRIRIYIYDNILGNNFTTNIWIWIYFIVWIGVVKTPTQNQFCLNFNWLFTVLVYTVYCKLL